MPVYIPEKGDFILANFDPQSEHEQKCRRPALVISNALFNKATGLAVVCPTTNTNRNIPFHVAIKDAARITGFIMVEQVKSIDYNSRQIKFVEKVHTAILNDVLSVLDACIYQDG